MTTSTTETVEVAPRVGNRSGTTSRLPDPKHAKKTLDGADNPAARPTPATTEPEHIETPAAPVTEVIQTAPEATITAPAAPQSTQTPATPASSTQPTPVASPQAAEVIEIDPTKLYKMRDGRTVTGATMLWEENLQKKASREINEAKVMKEDVQGLIATAVEKAVAAVIPHAQPQPAPAAPTATPTLPTPPVKPEGEYENSPKMLQYERDLAQYNTQKSVIETVSTIVAPIINYQQEQQKTIQSQRAAREVEEHNARMANVVLVDELRGIGIDYTALTPQQKSDVAYRIRQTSESYGFGDILHHTDKIPENQIETIALRAFSDGWRPTAEQPVVPEPEPLPAAAIEMADRLREGKPVVDPVQPPTPLIPPDGGGGTGAPRSAAPAGGRVDPKSKYTDVLQGKAKFRT